ncbi:hypothetical protein CTI14_45605, partial [Methylobacterium radiotolerans]
MRPGSPRTSTSCRSARTGSSTRHARSIEWHSVDGVRTAWENAVRKLGVDYLDLFLIHWPNPDQDTYVQAWEGLIRLRAEGKVRSIGTSNFFPGHLQRLIDATG